MAYYAVPGSQTAVTSAYKTAAQVTCATSGTVHRVKVYELLLGAASNPNATDTYIQFDVSRITSSGVGAYTSWTPTLLDPADGASLSLAGVNATAEATGITANSSLFNEGINQRASVRWVASQESQSMVGPATASNGLTLRAQSSTFAATATGQLTYQE